MGEIVYPSQLPVTIVSLSSRQEVDRGEMSGERRLLQLRDAIDDAEPDVVAELDLDHLRRKAFADLVHVAHCELDLTAAALDEVIEQQGREVADLLVVGMLTEVQYLRHDGFNISLW
jgi:hypothetical protein